jgi:type II secretory ATPase GspE/PulE/Tfp pilus assembly ATPase PilB-like protein
LGQDLILELMNGQHEQATLVSPFIPENNKIEVILAATGQKQTISLSEVCCLRMAPEASNIQVPDEELPLESIGTTTGKIYHARMITGQDFQTGCFGISTEDGTPLNHLFFTFLGILERTPHTPPDELLELDDTLDLTEPVLFFDNTRQKKVGQILEENLLISQEDLQIALNEQQQLKSRRVGEILAEDFNIPQETIDHVIEKARQDGIIPQETRIGQVLMDASLISQAELDESLALQQTGRDKQIGSFLVERGMVTEDQLLEALGIKQAKPSEMLGEILERKGLVSENDISAVLEEQKKLKELRVGEIIADQHKVGQEAVETAVMEAAQKAEKLPTPKMARKVGEILLEAGLVTMEQVEQALVTQKGNKTKKIGAIFIEKGLITETQLLHALATKFQLRFVDLDEITPSQKALKTLSHDIVHQEKVFPIDENRNRLVVATSDPTDSTIVDTLRFHANRRVELVIASADQIAEAIEKYYYKAGERLADMIDGMADDDVSVDEEEKLAETSLDESDSQIIKLVNKVLVDAYTKGASDIHLEPGPGKAPLNVRYRIDGVCFAQHNIPSAFKKAFISRVKIISSLDISERRKPQSGKIMIRYRRKKLEFRVETTPTVGGQEDAVLRILAASKPLPLEKMGFSPKNLKTFQEFIFKPYGIILCVGPTGSGKTTTLHSALSYINTPERKIWTAEDPVEITQDGLRQVQVHAKIGLTFQEALRSFLRADPDVIMIGEMRDMETAQTAIEASLTGHLVFSTLHTNNAPETVTRLIEMGLEPFNFAEALLCIVAQRLTRRLCNNCKETYHPTQEDFDNLVQFYDQHWYKKHEMPIYSEDLSLKKAKGCKNCDNGYKGRISVLELLANSHNIKKAIINKASADDLKNIALQEGMKTLRMDGIEKVYLGDTDMEQVTRVCL